MFASKQFCAIFLLFAFKQYGFELMDQLPARTATLDLPSGTHWLCTCGQSKNYPNCDGAHKGTNKQPIEIVLETPKSVEVSA